MHFHLTAIDREGKDKERDKDEAKGLAWGLYFALYLKDELATPAEIKAWKEGCDGK